MGRGRPRRGTGGSASGRKRPLRAFEEEEEVEPETGQDLVGEDYCFICKDGGDLRICDFRSCNKAYHPGCVGKDISFLTSDEEFICEWHTCFICKGRSRYYCFCCPRYAFCKGCVAQAEFVPVLRKTKGFCVNCLRMAVMIERNVDVDSDGEMVDFSDKETYEFLFKDYWKIVKDKEGLTLDKLEEAYAFLKKDLDCKQAGLDKVPDEDRKSDSDFLGNSDDDDEPCYPSYSNESSKKSKSFLTEGRSKKNGHMNWGSEALIQFLSSVGKDTSNSLDQFSTGQIVKQYIQQNNLLSKDKKKVVVCDDKLKSLFRKSKVKFNKIYSLLKKHITANIASDDEDFISSEDNNDSAMTKKSRTAKCVSSTPKRTSEINKKCLASLESDNIKLIYLKKSLVMNLLKEPDTFEHKVTGCFVRVKNDPKDYCYNVLKKPYQLGQVTGIRKSPEEYKIRDISTDVLLRISDMLDVRISMLSDEDFEKDECEDLHLLAQKGLFKRLTVGELEEKARSMHRDIVSHRIDKEILILEKLIEMANEKGWRSKMHEYMDKKNLLCKPSERRRLLEEIPQVIPDMKDSKDTESQVPAEDKSIQKKTVVFQDMKDRKDAERQVPAEDKSIQNNTVDSQVTKKGADGTVGMDVQKQDTEAVVDTEVDAAGEVPCAPKRDYEANKTETKGDTFAMHFQRRSTEGDTLGKIVKKKAAAAVDSGKKPQVIIDLEDDDNLPERGGQMAVIDLGGADGASHTQPVQQQQQQQQQERNNTIRARGIPLRKCVWYYMDPQGDDQGPFTMEHLRHWWDSKYFPEDFKVWRKGQSRESAVFLRDVL